MHARAFTLCVHVPEGSGSANVACETVSATPGPRVDVSSSHQDPAVSGTPKKRFWPAADMPRLTLPLIVDSVGGGGGNEIGNCASNETS